MDKDCFSLDYIFMQTGNLKSLAPGFPLVSSNSVSSNVSRAWISGDEFIHPSSIYPSIHSFMCSSDSY